MLKQRALAMTLALVMVASVVAPGLALSIAPATAAASGPSDMVALGDAQVHEDLPAGADAPITAADLEGSVWASDHAETMDITVTTPDRAGAYVEENSNPLEGDDIAVVVSDDENHDARDVAVDAQLLEDALGYQPEAAFGVHSSGDEWSSGISYDGGAAVFEVPKFSENTVSFTGGITLSGSNAVAGTSYSYDLDSLDGVDKYQINLTGHRLTEANHRTATTDSGTLGIDVGGTTAPEGAEVTLTGQRIETNESVSGLSDGDSITVGGNNPPEQESVTIEGSGSLSAQSQNGILNDGGSDSVSVDGEVAPPDSSLTISATYSESLGSVSGSGGASKTVEGGSLGGGDATLTVVDGGGGEATHSPGFISIGGDGSDDSVSWTVDTSNVDKVEEFTQEFTETHNAEGELLFYVDGNYLDSYSLNARDSAQSFTTSNFTPISVGDTAEVEVVLNDGSQYRDAEIYEDEFTYLTEYDDDTTVNIGGDQTTISGEGSHSSTLSSGSTTVEISTTNAVSWELDWTERNGVENPSVSVDGSTVSHSGVLDGQVTESISLSRGTHSISSSHSGEGLDYELSWTEDHRTHDPSVTVDGSTISHSGPLATGETASGAVDLSTGDHLVSVDSTGSTGDVTVDWTEIQQTENPSVEINADTIAHAGELSQGQTTSQAIDLPLGSSTADISSDGPVAVDIDWTEVSETTDAGVIVNGNERTIDGTIPEGQTESLPADEAWLEEGTNEVQVVTADAGSGPAPEVGLEYQHEAGSTSIEETVAASTWKESYNVSHKFPSEQADAEAKFAYADNVIEIRNLEQRTNGGEWQTVAESDYSLENSTLVVDLGDVTADTTVDIRATGGKIQTYDGSVNIVEPTAEGDALATDIEVTDVVDGGTLGIDVSETAVDDRIHYSSDESFEGSAHAEVTASGTQVLRAPDANAGSTMTIETMPVDVRPESGAMEVEVEQAGSEPRFQMREGDTIGAAEVEVAYFDTLSGERYVLWSETEDREVDAERASSPVFFVTDGSSETYSILQRDDPSTGGGGGGAPAESGSGLALSLILPAVAISVGGLWWAGRRFGGARGARGNTVLLVGASIIAVVAAELVTPRSLTSDIVFALGDALSAGAGAAILAVLVLLGVWQVDRRTEADVPWWITAFVGFAAVVLTAESIRPGSILGSLEGILAEVGAAVVLMGIIAVAAILWRRSGTAETEVVIDGGDSE